jgi:F0F1-type ATP synthase assembly protein I
MPDDKDPNDKRQYRQMFEASALAWMFPIAMGLGALWWRGMDNLFGTWPWLTAIFTGFGVIAAFVNLFRIGLKE